MSQLRLYLLGSPKIQSNGRELEFDTRKAVALLAFLAVTSEAHNRDSLSALLWPELDQIRARAALRRTLSTLKNAIPGDNLVSGRETIAVDRHSVWLDIEDFREHISACHLHSQALVEGCIECIPRLQAAVDLYRGDFLTGFTLRDSAAFDDWQFFQTESLRRELAHALEKLSACLASRGDFEAAISHARRWLSIDPLHEKAHRQLMRLFAYSGRREAALRQYQECVRILEEELDVAPLEETVRLYYEIKENRFAHSEPDTLMKFEDADLSTSVIKPALVEAFRVDSSHVPLVGRDEQWTRLLDLYRSLSNDGHFVLIEGETGIGKTRLAEEFLAFVMRIGGVIVHARCYEGERNLSYGPIVESLRHSFLQATRPDWLDEFPAAWLSEVARLLPELHVLRPGLPSVPLLENPGAQSRFFEAIDRFLLAMFKGPFPGVLFLDDLQWADYATLDLISYLVRRAKGRPYLILGTCRREDLVSGHPLRDLIGEAKRAIRGSQISLERLSRNEVSSLIEATSVTEVPRSASERLYNETDGLPYFVVEYLSELLQDNRLGKSQDWALPGSIRDLLHSRLKEVTEAGRQLLTTAAVIGRSFGFDTLREASGRGEEETISGLESLVAKGLIEEVPDSGDNLEPYYDFRHEKLRTLVYEETGSARRRLLHRRVAEALTSRSRSLHPPARLFGQIAHHFRLGGETVEAARNFKLAGDYARSIHANNDALSHYQEALELDHPDRGELFEAIADLQTLLGDYAAALQNYSNALSESGSFARLEHKIGNIYQRQGEWEIAEKHYQVALDGLDNGDSTGERARIMADRSLTAYHCSEQEKAKVLALQALRYAQEERDKYAESQAHNILGILARTGGDFDTAGHHLDQSLSIAEESQDPEMRIAALNNLALVFRAGKDLNRAIELTEEALRLCILQGDRHREAALHSNLADLLHKVNRPEEAIDHLKKSVVLFAEIGENAKDLNPEVWKLVDW